MSDATPELSATDIRWTLGRNLRVEDIWSVDDVLNASREDLEILACSALMEVRTLRPFLHDTIGALAHTVDQRDREAFRVRQLRRQARSAAEAQTT